MANNGWALPPDTGGGKRMVVPEDSWWNYSWAGGADTMARYLGVKADPTFYTEDEFAQLQHDMSKLYQPQEQLPSEPARMLSEGREPEAAPVQGREMTIGEKIAGVLGAYGQKFGPLRALTDPKSLESIGLTGGIISKEADDNAFTQWLKDFGRSASTSFTQTGAQTIGALTDVAAGNFGKNQDYTVMGNRPEDYYNYGGSAQTIGSFADDIAIALATSGMGNYLLAGSTAARGYSGLQMAAGLRAGAASVPTLFGRAIGPSATALQRTVGAIAGAAPVAVSSVPELVAGRTNLGEVGADVALGGIGGYLSFGSWGGSRLRNIASDALVNLGTGAVQGLTPLLPGGREFNPEEYWQSLAYGAAVGTALGVAGAKPDPRVSSDVSFGRRYDPNAQPVDQGPSPTATPSMGGDILRQAEEMAFGRSDIQPGMSAAEAVERTAQARTPADVQTLRRNPDGSVSSLSDQMIRGEYQAENVDPKVVQQAAEIERQVYVDALMQMHDAPTLVKALDLEVEGPVTPDILRGKIINEWANQAANGAGIAGIENRLQSMGLDSPIPQAEAGTTQGQAGPTPAPASPETGFIFGQEIPAVMGEQTLGQVPGFDLGLRMAAPGGVAGLPPLPEAPPVRAGDQMSFAQAITDPTLANLDQRMQMNQAARGMVTGPESRAYPTNIMPEAPLGSAGLITAGPPTQQMDLFGQLSGQIPPASALPLPPPVAGAPVPRAAQPQPTTTQPGAINEGQAAGEPVSVPAGTAGVEPPARSIEIPRDQIRTNAIPNESVRASVRQYNAENNLPESIENHYVPVVEERAKSIADAYDALPVFDESPETTQAYTALAQEIQQQWDFAINKLGITFEPWVQEGQPYANSREMIRDVQDNKHLYFFTGGEPHPLLNEPDASGLTMNDKLRAIHDLFGHAAEDYQFGPRGEENAWLKHSQMFSPLAQRALTTETRGQNSWVNYGRQNYNEDGTRKAIPAAERPFATQKVALLPEEFNDWRGVLAENGIDVTAEAPPTVADVPVKVLADATQSTDIPAKPGMEPVSRPRTRISIVEAAREVSQGAEDVAGALHKNVLEIEDRRRTSTGNRNSTKIRTDQPLLDKIADLAAGKPVDLGITKAGRAQRILKVIGDAEGKMDGSDVRRQILAGRREFAKGTIKITETPDGKYVAQMTANPLEVASATLKAMPEATIKEIDARAELNIAEKRQRRSLQDAYADIEDAFKEEVSGIGKVKTPVEVEDGYSSGAGALEMGEDSGMGNKSKNPTTQDYENWKMNVAERQAEVADLALEEFDRRGLLTDSADNPIIDINPKHIQFWLMDRVGAPGWKEAGKLFLNRQVPEATKEFLDTHFESVMAQTPGLRQRFDSLVRINGTAPSKQVANGVRRRAENTAKIFDNAAEVARMAGIEEPTKVIDYMRYMRIKRKMSMRDQIMTPEEAQDIAEKLARVADDPNGLALIKELDAANEALEGKATWARILDQNFRNLGPGIRAQLRNFPIIRTALTAGLMFGMDDLVETIEDDETYFGIPGSILRKVLGDGNAGTYAVMGSMPFLRGKLKSTMKPGTRAGIREFAASVKQRMQDRAENVSESFARRSLGGLPDAELRARAEEVAARPGKAIDPNTGLKLEPGTQEYEAWIVDFMDTHRKSHNPNFKFGDSKGVIGVAEKWFTDLNLARVKIPFIDEFLGRKLDEMQVAQRKAAAEIKSFFDDTYAPIMQKYRKANDARIPKAMAAFDYRMSDLANAKGRINDEVYYQAKKAEEDRIRDEFFTIETPEGPKLDEAAYNDYLKIQEVFNPLRSRHLYALVSFQEGIPYYETAAHRQKLIEERQSVHQMFGAAEAQQKKLEVELQKFNDEMAAARKNGAAAPELAEFEAKRRTLQQDLAEQIKLTSDIEAQVTSLDASILRLTTIDDMVVRSQETGYILRHRDNDAQYVLRLSYDGDFKMPGVRREYASRNIADLALPDQARAFASEFQAKRIIDLTNKLNDVEAKLAVDPENVKLLEQQQRYEKALAQENAEGRKSFSEMTNIEVLDYLRSQNVKADVYRRSRRTAKLNTAAYKAINDALNAAEKLEGILVGRSNEDFSRPVNYVNKENVSGNQTLVDAGADGGVVTYDIPPGTDQKSFIDAMVEAVDDLVDGTIDKEQLRELLEQKYTYREVKVEGAGKGRRVVEQIHIDMPALRAIVSRYLEPSMPNLAKRNNVSGYYDPDGTWTAKQHWDYITGSAEVMQGQISSYTVRSASRGILSDALDRLRRYDVDNGLAEFISSYTTQDANLSDLEDLAVRRAYSARRAYSILTLATNVSNAIQNRIYGAALSAQHQGMHILTKYGVTQQKPDGSKSEVKWMNSQAEARAFIADKAEKGEVGWSEVKGATLKNIGLKDFGITAGALIAPQTTIRVLAKVDPYWKAVYEESKRLNLQEGSAIGNYTMREAIDKGTPREKVVNLLTYMTRKIENANNWTSILASASTAKTRMGITSQDFATLGTGQLSSAMETVLRPSMDRMALHNKAGETLRAEIANIKQRLADPKISKGERIHLEKLVEQKQKYVAEQDLTPERVFLDSVMEYIVLDRQFEQGGWTKMDQTRLERELSKNPAGVIATTFAAPMFRATSSYLAMLREAKNTHSGFTGKLVRYAPVIVGGAALTMLMGIKANTTAIGPMMFVSDMVSLGEYIYDLFTTDDDNKVTAASSRGMWEGAGEYLAEKMGMDPKFGRDYVRAFFSEGLIRYVTDMAVSSESGVFDGLALPGAQGILTTGKNMFKTVEGYYKVDDFVGAMYNTTNALPTSLKRGTQAVIQGTLGTKLDRYGNPIKEEFGGIEDIGKYKKFDIGDAIRHAVAGKRWSEIRSTLYDMDGTFDVSTPEDAVRFANYLESTSGISFGAGLKSRKPGPKESFQMAAVERDAYYIQRKLQQNHSAFYAKAAEEAKNRLNDMINSGEMITLTDRQGNRINVTMEQALTMAGTGGNKTEQDLARKGGATVSARQQMMQDIDKWMFSTNVKNTIDNMYGEGRVKNTDKLMTGRGETDPVQYAQWKFMQRLYDSFLSESERRRGRTYYEGYNTP